MMAFTIKGFIKQELIFLKCPSGITNQHSSIQGDGIYHQRFHQTGVDFSQVSLRDHKSTFELVVNSPLFLGKGGEKTKDREGRGKRSLLK